MNKKQEILKLIQSHKALEPFDYRLVVDWAIDIIGEGKETENVLILASFSNPIEKYEISPYVTAVLNELGLEELQCDDALIAQAHFLLYKILRNEAIRENLKSLSQLCINNNFEKRIMDFYLLNHGWRELEEIGANYYFDGEDLNNIEEVLKKAAKKWIDKYVYEKEDSVTDQELKKTKNTTHQTLHEQAGK
jgi:hypothetical protein